MFRWNFVIYPAVGRTIKFSPEFGWGGAICQQPVLSISNDLCGGTKINMFVLLGSGEAIFFLNVDFNVEENEKVGGIMKGSLVN